MFKHQVQTPFSDPIQQSVQKTFTDSIPYTDTFKFLSSNLIRQPLQIQQTIQTPLSDPN